MRYHRTGDDSGVHHDRHDDGAAGGGSLVDQHHDDEHDGDTGTGIGSVTEYRDTTRTTSGTRNRA